MIARNIVAFARVADKCGRHSSWPEALNIQGRSLDLTAAYKQCPLDPSQAQYAVVALDEPLDTATETSGKM
eukprot:2665481-Amphidinium_carterae.1